jgi:hypothetical protein
LIDAECIFWIQLSVASWWLLVEKTGMALFSAVAEVAEELAGEAGKLKKRAAMARAISAVHAARPESDDAGLFALYLAGTPFAEADGRKLNAGGALLSKALLAVSGASGVELTAAYRRHGDMGAAAFDLLAGSIAVTGGEESGRAAHDAHISESRYGAPGLWQIDSEDFNEADIGAGCGLDSCGW